MQQDRLLLLRGMEAEVQEEGLEIFADLDSRRNDSGNAGNTNDTPRSTASLTVAPPTCTREILDPRNASAPASSPLALANRNTAGPSRPRTGPAARERVPGSAYDKAVADEEGEDEKERTVSRPQKARRAKGKRRKKSPSPFRKASVPSKSWLKRVLPEWRSGQPNGNVRNKRDFDSRTRGAFANNGRPLLKSDWRRRSWFSSTSSASTNTSSTWSFPANSASGTHGQESEPPCCEA